MKKLDLTKEYKTYFTATTKPMMVEIEKANFISITGKGDPSGEDFVDKIRCLYPVAYTLKFISKARNKDFVVSKLEGLWWYDEKKFTNKNLKNAATDVPRSEWEYRLLIRIPEFVTEKDVHQAISAVVQKKNIQGAKQIKYFTMAEGTCVQMLHVGSFATEPQTLQEIGAFIEQNRLSRNGVHHEIYLSDFRKVQPEKLRTILREPVR